MPFKSSSLIQGPIDLVILAFFSVFTIHHKLLKIHHATKTSIQGSQEGTAELESALLALRPSTSRHIPWYAPRPKAPPDEWYD